MSEGEPAAVDVLFKAALSGRLDAASETFAEFASGDASRGLGLQLQVLARWQEAGEELGGWKIGQTSRGARDSLGKGFRPFGYVLRSRVFPSGSVIDLKRISSCALEVEIGCVIGKPLHGRSLSTVQTRDGVASLFPAFEINERRFSGRVPTPIRVGNDLGQWGIVVGAQHSTDVDLGKLAVSLHHEGCEVAAGTSEPDVIDDPYLSLSRVCDRLAEHGLGLEPGQHVITGSLLPAHEVEQHGTWTGLVGELGEVTVAFS